MKKIISYVLILFLLCGLLSCSKQKESIKILSPEGIPAIALGGLLTNEDYDITLVNGANVLSVELMKDEYDIIVAPIIMGAQLYIKGEINYQLKSIITLGNSFLVFKKEDHINSLKDLEGQTVASYGQNTAPDILFKAALINQGVDIEKINFVYEDSVASVLSNRFMGKDNIKYILCAEPIISKMETALKSKIGDIEKINLQECLSNEISNIPQAGIFVRKETKNNYDFFFTQIKENIEFLNLNPSEYAKTITTIDSEYQTVYTNLGENLIINSIPNSMIVYMEASKYKKDLNTYFSIINKYNEKILNNGEIDEEFYKE